MEKTKQSKPCGYFAVIVVEDGGILSSWFVCLFLFNIRRSSSCLSAVKIIVTYHQFLLCKQVRGDCQTKHILRQFEQKLGWVPLGISLGTNTEVRTLISKLCEKPRKDWGKDVMVADPGSNGVKNLRARHAIRFPWLNKLLLVIRTWVIDSDQRKITQEILSFSKHWNRIYTLCYSCRLKACCLPKSLSVKKEYSHRHRTAIEIQKPKNATL